MLKIFTALTIIILAVFFVTQMPQQEKESPRVLGFSGAPPDGAYEYEVPQDPGKLYFLKNWVRPNVPVKVALQAGHWKNQEVPEELKKLKGNTGSTNGEKWEWEVNLSIANMTAELLRKEGINVEVLPTVVPPEYWADVFLAIHADGSDDSRKSGYKFASPWRDFSGNSKILVDILDVKYATNTGLVFDDNVSRNMRGYYAFSWWKYEHAIHPMTTAAIAELGFLTNRSDAKLLIDSPEIPSQALADAIMEYLREKSLI
ncbi:hypothetical protein C4564_04065 [Candidatus Microgenomates bacterium]|nr:MAG: hypothetical protein C4564_04065 [Candidatus Microgenomates bacterium]